MGNSMSCKRAISLRDLGFSLSQRESCLSHSVKRGGNKRSIKGEKKEQRLVFHFTDVSELDEILEEIELALGDVSGNKAVERKTSQALETNLNDVGTMFTSMSTKCQDANSQMGSAKLVASASMEVLRDVLESAKNLSWAGAALAMVAYTLRRIDRMHQNDVTCQMLLKSMSSLAKHIRALIAELPEHDLKLRDATFLIARGVALCNSHCRRGLLSKFGFADTTMNDLEQLCLEIRDVYPDLNLAVTQQRVEEVISMLKLDAPEVRAVVLHGLPGIGKSTLGDAVYARLNFPGRTHCRIEVGENPSAEKICSLQASMLERLSGDKVKMGYPLEGRQKLGKYLEECRESLFLYIDNVVAPSDLQELLPEQLILPLKSRILVTSRVANLCSELEERGVASSLYEVEELDFAQAKQMFCSLVFEEEQPPTAKNVQVSQVLKACGGMPLALELVGKYLRRQKSRDSAWTHTLKSLQRSDSLTGTKDMRSYLGKLESMYEQLSEPLQRAFLDVITYYLDLPWEMVSHVLGEDQLLALQELAFVKRSPLDVDGIDRVHVHDLLVSLGRKLEPGLRISSSEEDQLPTFLKSDHVKEKKPVEGLCLRNCKEELLVESLDSLSASLRILILQQDVSGQCRKIPAHLQLFITQGSMPFTHIEKLTELAVLKLCEVDMDFDLVQFPDRLQSLIINDCQTLKELPEWFTDLHILSTLDLSFCKNLETLPDDFGRLTSLQSLELQDCKALEHLPQDLTTLTTLQRLNLGGCEALKSLPNNFHHLSMLQRLKLWRCGRLSSLPKHFGGLLSLQELNMSFCESLECLPDEFGDLSNLQSLELRFCRALKVLPEGFVNLSAIQRLDLTGCEMLVTLPEGFGRLTGLWELHLDECESLQRLPEGFEGLVSLHTLSLVGCCNVSALPDDFGALESLLMLKLTDCASLVALPHSFRQLAALKSLDVAGASDEVITSVGELVSSSCNINYVPEVGDMNLPEVSDMIWQMYLQEPVGPRWLMFEGNDADDF